MVDSFADSDLFKGLSEPQRNEVISSGKRNAIQSSSILFHQGDPATQCFMVLRGRLKLTMLSEEGKEVTIRYINANEVTAVSTVLKDKEYPATAKSLSDTEFIAWDKPGLIRLMKDFPPVAINLLHIVLKRLDDLQQRYLELCTERVEQRIARALLRLMQRTGLKTSEGICINIPLSRQDIADYIGTTMFTVSRTLSAWEKKGLLKTRKNQIIVVDPHNLVQFATLD